MARTRLVIQSLIPWTLFFAFDNYGRTELNLCILAALGFVIIVNNQSLRRGFIFDWASLLFFLFLLIVIVFFKNTWFILNAPSLGIYTIAATLWISLIIKQPITMQYARLSVTKELWNTKLFYRINAVLTLMWALILTVISVLNIVERLVWGGALWLNELLPTVLLMLGLWFTFWFPEWYKRNIVGERGVISIKNLSGLQISHATIANISFRTLGKGQKLIMLTPAHMNMYGWDPELLRILAKKHQVIIINYPDIGESKLKQGDHSVTNLTKAIAEFIRNISDGKVAVLGYDLGGWIAQELAIKYPELVEKLVLIATDVGSPRATLADKHTREILMLHTMAPDSTNEQLMKLMFPENVLKTILPKMRAIFFAADFNCDISSSVISVQHYLTEQWYNDPGTYQQLGEIDANTLIITGAQDQVINRQNSLLLVNGIRGAHFIEYADAGHGVVYQHPASIADAVNKL